MSENFTNKQPISENIQDVDVFFDNIPDCEDDFTFLQDNNSFEMARSSFQELTNSSNSKSSSEEDDSATQSIATESTEPVNDISIPQINEKACLTACAVVDIDDEKIKCCGKTENLRRLWQLVGTWQLDKSTVKSVGGNLDKLGVCYSHFMFDQNQLHSEEGGHLYVKPGRGNVESSCHFEGKHKQDLVNSLELINKWIITSNNTQLQIKILNLIVLALQILDSENDDTLHNTFIKSPPSLFSIKTIFKLYKININNSDLTPKECLQIGSNLAENLEKSHKEFKNLQQLELPNSLDEYQLALPKPIYFLFEGIISNLLENKKKAANKKQIMRKKPIKPVNQAKIKRISAFLTSIIFSLSQKKIKIWLPTILSSLCRKPRLLSSLHQVLQSVNVVAHTDRHERRLENKRMSAANPTSRLKKNSKIWNVCVIDNIDFKEKTFTFGNIYNSTRTTTHATLRMVFQFELPISIESINDDIISLEEQTYLFGPNQFANETLIGFQLLISQLLNCKQKENNLVKYSCEFDSDTVNTKIIEQINIGVQCLPPHVVILEAGGNPSNNEEIFATCEKYIEDLELTEEQPVEIFCDEAIFHRVIKLHQKKSNIRPLLGQWHTSKDMCGVLLTIFSSYGIYNLAVSLGVKFLDKLESVVDYRSTCRVLDLIWLAVACAIQIHVTEKQIEFSQIENGNNNLLKVWYCFYKWCGWWKAHWGGIRTGNTNTQLKCLAAFAPLFPAGGKLNYTQSTVHFLALLSKYPRLKKLLHYAGSVNLTREGHYYAFDEALETFGVKYIKQNITGNVINEENLKHQIKAAQTERERIDLLLAEFIGDNVMSYGKHSVDNRNIALWNLIKTLVKAFGSVAPLKHPLFKNNSQLNSEGCQKLFKCYDAGLERLKKIYRQEILQIEAVDTKGRRAKEVVVSKVKDIKKAEKEAEKIAKLSEKQSLISTQKENSNPEQLSSPFEEIVSDTDIGELSKEQKVTRHRTTQQEKDLLAPLLTPNAPTEKEVEEVLDALLQFWNGWTKKKVRDYWSHHKPKKI